MSLTGRYGFDQPITFVTESGVTLLSDLFTSDGPEDTALDKAQAYAEQMGWTVHAIADEQTVVVKVV